MTKQCPKSDQTPVQACPVESTSVHLSPPDCSQNTQTITIIHRQNRLCRLFNFSIAPWKILNAFITPVLLKRLQEDSNAMGSFFIEVITKALSMIGVQSENHHCQFSYRTPLQKISQTLFSLCSKSHHLGLPD